LFEARDTDVGRSQYELLCVHIVAPRAITPGSHSRRRGQRPCHGNADGDLGTATTFVPFLNNEIGVAARVQDERLTETAGKYFVKQMRGCWINCHGCDP